MESMQHADAIIDACLAAIVLRRRKRRKKRSTWVMSWIERRSSLGAYHSLLHELAVEDEHAFNNFLRMDLHHFHFLLNLVRPYIEKDNTHMRNSISAGERLAVTLRFLATGDSYISLSYLYRLGRSTVGNIVPETCRAIISCLKDKYLKVPSTTEEWRKIAAAFHQVWNFPHCLGAIDGKHIRIQAPPNSGSTYFNYKDFHSIILLAVVDPHYRFVWYQLGDNGRQNDAGVFGASKLAEALENNSLNFPEPTVLREGSGEKVPFMLIGDDAFPLKPFLMKPYPQKGLEDDQKVFNYRLCRARRVSENAFGILVNKFRVLAKTINLEPHVAVVVTEACMALHNFLKTERDGKYAQEPRGETQLWQGERPTFYRGNYSASVARKVRDELKEYFVGEGQVHYQWAQIH